MSLLEDLADDSNFPSPRKALCSVCALLTSLTEKEVKAFQARLDDKKTSHTALVALLKRHNIHISDSVMGRHRRGVCQGVVGR